MSDDPIRPEPARDQALHSELSAEALRVLHKVVEELPDACERLRYVQEMTEQAANKVLNLVEKAQSDAGEVARKGQDLAEALERLASSDDMSVDRARAMMRLCAAYARQASGFGEREQGLHTELMLAQGFQDLSGQVINKVIGMLDRVESPLQQLLASSEPPAAAEEASVAGSSAALEGVQTPDKALKQDDVDDLLASLGF
ncbi:protein phosphatase CheZ [Pelomonas sp. APW6]|uniref:Protein phosphatase CheZ n=1 Tax=Roseateles subflavus TaxID=3053353 RepID=A0ABT7LK12_9BURK|nr:protein phosphatase CheZ [Pelomonas sp. APW6]MDL5032607.1 protein phosphatase CheZ [Pelomonas sp. APW6]